MTISMQALGRAHSLVLRFGANAIEIAKLSANLTDVQAGSVCYEDSLAVIRAVEEMLASNRVLYNEKSNKRLGRLPKPPR